MWSTWLCFSSRSPPPAPWAPTAAGFALDAEGWRPLEKRRVWLPVKLWGPFTLPVPRDVWRAVQGPVMRGDKGNFAIRYAGADQVRMLEQYYRINRARSWDEWNRAMALNGVAATNFIYADRTGRIALIYNAMFPRRKAGFDYRAVLPGDTSRAYEPGHLGWAVVPKNVDPPSGFLQNANNSPYLAAGRGSELPPQPPLLGVESKLLGNAIAFVLAMAVMVALAWVIERLVLGKLVNQEGITLLMATLGIAHFLDGFGQTLFGNDIYKIDVGMPKDPMFLFESLFPGGVMVSQEELMAALIAAALVAALSAFFQYTATGRALRAVADDHQAAQSIGIPLKRIWVIVWSVAGFVALVAGIIWGSKLGVQFSLSQVALKALPVVILGGLTSVPGAIIGGLIIGVGEKLSEVFIGPMLGGGIEIWFAYVLALIFLLVRPQGLFGEKIIDRV